jgi:hypothetical protein
VDARGAEQITAGEAGNHQQQVIQESLKCDRQAQRKQILLL